MNLIKTIKQVGRIINRKVQEIVPKTKLGERFERRTKKAEQKALMEEYTARSSRPKPTRHQLHLEAQQYLKDSGFGIEEFDMSCSEEDHLSYEPHAQFLNKKQVRARREARVLN